MTSEQAIGALRQLGRDIGMVASLERRRRLPELSDSDYASMLRTLDEWEKRVHAATDVLAALAAPVAAEPRDRDAYIQQVRESTAALADRVGKAEVGPAQAEPAAPSLTVQICELLGRRGIAVPVSVLHEIGELGRAALPASSPAAPVAMPEKP